MTRACPTSHAYIDRLRVAATVAVVLIHVTLGSLETVTPFSPVWWIGHWICLMSQWAVPVFVMISGALLLDPDHGAADSPSVFYRKRARRIGWPLGVWTALYFVIRKAFDHEPVTATYILNHLLQADPPYHTYFLFVIAGVYLVTPVLRVLVQTMSCAQRQGLICLIFGLASGYALANAWFWDNPRFLFSFFVPYLGYYLCGYELTHLPDTAPTRRLVIWALGLSVLYILLIGPVYTDTLGRQSGRFVLGYFSVPVVVMSMAIFRAAWQRERLAVQQPDGLTERLSRKIAPATFGIYLVHVAVLITLRDLTASQNRHSPFLVNVILGTVLAFGVSYGITVVMQKIPGLKRLV